MEERVQLQTLVQRHLGAHQERRARGIGVLPDGGVIRSDGNLGRELTRVAETAVRAIELQRDRGVGRIARGNRRIPGELQRAERAGGELQPEWRVGRPSRLRYQLDRAAEGTGAELRAEHAAADDELAHERGGQRRQIDRVSTGTL